MGREKYNLEILEKTLSLLKRDDSNSITEALRNTCYLVEQGIKRFIHDKNPILYYDNRSLTNPRTRALVATGSVTTSTIKSVDLNEAISIFLELKKADETFETLLEDLRTIRNEIDHSIFDVGTPTNTIGEVTTSTLNKMKPYLSKVCGIDKKRIEVITFKELEKRQKELEKRATKELKAVLSGHLKSYQKLSEDEISQRSFTPPKMEWDTFLVDEIYPCPACRETGLDKIGAVSFDWNPDGVMESGGYYYHCRVCDLHLNEPEYNEADRLGLLP